MKTSEYNYLLTRRKVIKEDLKYFYEDALRTKENRDEIRSLNSELRVIEDQLKSFKGVR